MGQPWLIVQTRGWMARELPQDRNLGALVMACVSVSAVCPGARTANLTLGFIPAQDIPVFYEFLFEAVT